MTKLKIDINFNSSCILSIKDITGFGTDGFVNPNVIIPTVVVDQPNYVLTDGYFINALIYNRYIGAAVIINTNEIPQSFTSGNVLPTYGDNFPTKSYKLSKDGVYTFKRAFVISKAFYLANADNIDGIAIYYDAVQNKYFKVVSFGATAVELTLDEVLAQTGPGTTGSITTYKFISTCYLNKCLYLLQSKTLSGGYSACDTERDIYRKQRDYITMTLQVIKYLKEDGHLTEVQRVIEVGDSCGMICKQIGNETENDCGCS